MKGHKQWSNVYRLQWKGCGNCLFKTAVMAIAGPLWPATGDFSNEGFHLPSLPLSSICTSASVGTTHRLPSLSVKWFFSTLLY